MLDLTFLHISNNIYIIKHHCDVTENACLYVISVSVSKNFFFIYIIKNHCDVKENACLYVISVSVSKNFFSYVFVYFQSLY